MNFLKNPTAERKTNYECSTCHPVGMCDKICLVLVSLLRESHPRKVKLGVDCSVNSYQALFVFCWPVFE